MNNADHNDPKGSDNGGANRSGGGDSDSDFGLLLSESS